MFGFKAQFNGGSVQEFSNSISATTNNALEIKKLVMPLLGLNSTA